MWALSIYCHWLISVDPWAHDQFEAFFNLNYPEDPAVWITHYAPSVALKTYLLSNDPLPSPLWFPPEVLIISPADTV